MIAKIRDRSRDNPSARLTSRSVAYLLSALFFGACSGNTPGEKETDKEVDPRADPLTGCMNGYKVALIAWNSGDIRAAFSTGSAFATPVEWSDAKANVDFGGNEANIAAHVKHDVLVAWSTSGIQLKILDHQGSGTYGPNLNPFVGAFYGGKANVVGHLGNEDLPDVESTIAWNWNSIYIRRMDQEAGSPIEQWGTGAFYGNRANVAGYITNSNRISLIAWNSAGVYVRTSTGTSFGPIELWSPGNFYGGRANLVGRIAGTSSPMALVAWSDNQVWVEKSNGSSFGVPEQWSSGTFFGTRANLVLDVNADGYDDLVAVDDNAVKVKLSNGLSFGATQQWGTGHFYGSTTTLGIKVACP